MNVLRHDYNGENMGGAIMRISTTLKNYVTRW